MFAGHRKLDNLCVIVDNNNLQIDGPITEVCSPYPIDKKFEAFNFHVINVDAHDFDALRAAFKEAKETKGMPTCIVAHSVKGKGVSFMENNVAWHGKAPNDAEYETAMADLEKIADSITFIDRGKILLTGYKDEILETHGVIKCSKEELKEMAPEDYVSARVNSYGAEVMVSDREAMRDKYRGMILDPTTLEEIMLFYVNRNNKGWS